MKLNWTFNLKYFLLFVITFCAEILIATLWKDIFFVRAYLGDVFVVMLIFYFIKSFIKTSSTPLIIGLFFFSCFIEILQYFHFAEWLGFGDSKIMMIILGNSFSWIDIICYLAGAIILLIQESIKNKNEAVK